MPAVELREVELFRVVLDGSSALFERRWQSVLQGILNLCRTGFLCAILGLGAFYFSKDANRLVLTPIQRMVAKVEEVSANPLIGLASNDTSAHSTALQDGSATLCRRQRKEVKNYETRILEVSLNKICSLMAVGFGDAGAEIIAENMRNGGALNPMVPGKKMCGAAPCLCCICAAPDTRASHPRFAAAQSSAFATSGSSRTRRRCCRRK